MRKVQVSAKLEYVPTNFNNRTASRTSTRMVYSWDLANMPIDPEDFLFCRVRACSADVPNRNADAFPYDELKQAYPTFINQGVYQDHKTDSVDDMRGIILDAVWKEADQSLEGGSAWVELLIAIDKGYEDLCRKVMKGAITDVSMGCSVQEGHCSICGNVCRGATDSFGNVTDMCDHIKYNKGETYNGKLVYENCYGVNFLEISAVTDGADTEALILDKNIQIEAVAPDHIKLKSAKPQQGNLRKVANTENTHEDTLVKDLPTDVCENVFNACKKASLNYWTLFSAVQEFTFKQAKHHILKHVENTNNSIKKDLKF